MEQQNRPVIVRISVPFCIHDCDFCTRNTIKGRDTQRMHFYAAALIKEIEAAAEGFSDCCIQALHLGGGLASGLGGPDLWNVVKALRDNYRFAPDAPVTLRASLLDINVGALPFFRRAGVTRYDFEVMSMEPLDFLHLGYPDTTRWIQDVSNVIRAAQTHSMGAVLLYGKQSTKPMYFRRTLLTACRQNISHVILQEYMGPDKSTPDVLKELEASARSVLGENGFLEYLPLRFAKPGCEDRFSLEKARGADLLGFGMGAITRFDGAMTTTTMDMAKYFCHSADFEAITESFQAL